MKLLVLTLVSFASIANAQTDADTVSRKACTEHGGVVSDSRSDKYFVCEGGKHDGVVTAGPASDCAAKVEKLKDWAEGPQDGAEVLAYDKAATDALAACTQKAADTGWRSVVKTLTSAKKTCDQAADQMSAEFKAMCYQKAAEYGRHIVN